MENASKALLIAASVLIAIVLIAIGVKMLNSTSGSIDESESSAITTEAQIFNQKVTKYLGKNKTKAEVISLIDTIISNNTSNNMKIGVDYGGTNYSYDINYINNILSQISILEENTKFKVDFAYENNRTGAGTSGFITKISIKTDT